MDNCEICNELKSINDMEMLEGGGKYICKQCLEYRTEYVTAMGHDTND